MKGTVFALAAAIGLFLGFLFVTPAPGGAAEKVINFSYSSHTPPELGVALGLEAWGKEIEKRTNGRVKFTYYHGGTLTSSPKCYEGVVKDLSDIGHSVFAYTQGRFPLMEVLDLPGYTAFNAKLSTRIADDMYRKFQPKELSDVHVLYLHCHTPGVWYTTKKAVKTLDDMKGLRIRCTGLTTKMVTALGGTPVGMPKADEYDSMQRGVVDGTVGAPTSLKSWRIAEVAKFSTWVPKAGYTNAQFVVMNKKKWESLSPDIQKAFTEVSQEWVDKTGDGWNSQDMEGVEYAKKLGHQFIHPDEKECARWEQALRPLQDEYVKATEARGLPGKAALEYRQQLMEKYGKVYKSLF